MRAYLRRIRGPDIVALIIYTYIHTHVHIGVSKRVRKRFFVSVKRTHR